MTYIPAFLGIPEEHIMADLLRAVEHFAVATIAAPDAHLDWPWAWGAYDSEGVRFAFFRVYEELRELVPMANATRIAQGNPLTSAQRILGQYHSAYRDLQAVLLGINDSEAEQEPAEGEWPLCTVLAHIVGADAGFFVVTNYALQQHRAGNHQPGQPPESFWNAELGDEADFESVMRGPLPELREYHEDLRQRALAAFGYMSDAELELPSRYWEGYDLSLRFRLHRFDSHMRQHTVQAEKTLALLGRGPHETRRLLRLIYAALADAESAIIGAPDVAGVYTSAANSITARADEIAKLLNPGAAHPA